MRVIIKLTSGAVYILIFVWKFNRYILLILRIGVNNDE